MGDESLLRLVPTLFLLACFIFYLLLSLVSRYRRSHCTADFAVFIRPIRTSEWRAKREREKASKRHCACCAERIFCVVFLMLSDCQRRLTAGSDQRNTSG